MAQYKEAKEHIEITESVDLQDGYKPLRKFGRGLCAAKQTKTALMTQVTTVIDVETHTTANLVDTLSSTASNTATIGVQGFTVDTSGDLTYVNQDATMNGTTAVTLTTPLNTVTRMYVKEGTFATPSSDVATNVYASESTNTGLTAGLPSSMAYCKAIMPANVNQTEKCANCTASNEYAAITALHLTLSSTVANNATGSCDLDVEIKRKGGVWRPAGTEIGVAAESRHSHANFNPPIVVPPNSYFRVVGNATTTDWVVAGSMEGVIFRTQGT